MPQYKACEIFPYTAEHLYHIVEDVGSYPQFVPGCQYARIVKRQAQDFWAEMEIGEWPIRIRYMSYVACVPHAQIHASLAHGSLKEMSTLWRFTPQENAEETQVYFEINLTLHHSWHNKVLEKSIEYLGQRMIHAFHHRATHLKEKIRYGYST